MLLNFNFDWRKLFTLVIFILIMLVMAVGLLSSCGPAHYLKKAERALKKAEQLGADISHDTLWKTMEVMVPEIISDTIFESIEGDTVFLTKDRLKIKYVNLPADSVYIYGECESDTVKIEIPVKVFREIRAGLTTWETIILCIAMMGIGWAVITFVVVPLVKRRKG